MIILFFILYKSGIQDIDKSISRWEEGAVSGVQSRRGRVGGWAGQACNGWEYRRVLELWGYNSEKCLLPVLTIVQDALLAVFAVVVRQTEADSSTSGRPWSRAKVFGKEARSISWFWLVSLRPDGWLLDTKRRAILAEGVSWPAYHLHYMILSRIPF